MLVKLNKGFDIFNEDVFDCFPSGTDLNDLFLPVNKDTNKPEGCRLQQICNQFPDHCIQLLFLN